MAFVGICLRLLPLLTPPPPTNAVDRPSQPSFLFIPSTPTPLPDHPRAHTYTCARTRTHTHIWTRECDWDGDIGIKNFIIEKRGGFRCARAEMDWIKRTKGLFYRSLSWKRHWVTRPRKRRRGWREVLCKRNKWIHLLFKAQGVMVGCHFGPEK